MRTITENGRILGYIAIDSTIAGRCAGGLRMAPDVTADEVRKLAASMTLKYGFLGLPHGGAKAGALGDPTASAEERQRILRRFARAARPVLGTVYTPHSDMGTTGPEMREMLEEAGVQVAARQLRGSKSGVYTARTVYLSVITACKDVAGSTVAIEGFGNVGQPLARMLAARGAKVVAISTSHGATYKPDGLDIAKVIDEATRRGPSFVQSYAKGERLSREQLLELPVNVLCPCARIESIHAGNAAKVQARLIAPGANNPATDQALGVLWGKGILVIPDFVANCGGVLGGTMEFAGYGEQSIIDFLDAHFPSRLARLLQSAEGPQMTAVRESRERFAQMQAASEHRSPRDQAFGLGMALYRNGWLPESLMRAASRRYFQQRLA